MSECVDLLVYSEDRKQSSPFGWCFTWKDAELKTYRPRFVESEDGSALQSRHHGHQRVEVVQFQQFLHTNKHLLFYYCYITSYTLDLFLLRDLTFAIFTKWLSISARIFSFWAVKISRTSQKLTCNSIFWIHSKRSLFIKQPKDFIYYYRCPKNDEISIEWWYTNWYWGFRGAPCLMIDRQP